MMLAQNHQPLDAAPAIAPLLFLGQTPPPLESPGYRVFDLHVDHLGSTRITTDQDGEVVSLHDFLPFGEEIVPMADANTKMFTGHERDQETGLDYMMARYLAPGPSRFMSPDPIAGQLARPQSLNKYAYVRNNPVNFIDPLGLYTCRDSTNCSSDQDKSFEQARQDNLNSGDPELVRSAEALGSPNTENGVTVGFADMSATTERGQTQSELDVDASGNPVAASTVTIDSSLSGTDLRTAVGHEGSHVADAQDMVADLQVDPTSKALTWGIDVSQYASEQRAYKVSDTILKLAQEKRKFECGKGGGCALGRGVGPEAKIEETIDRIIGHNYSSNGQPMSSSNPGQSVIPH